MNEPQPTDEIQIRLKTGTSPAWARAASEKLGEFLADHAACELQAAVYALSLVGSYPDDPGLAETLTALAAEELRHFRKALRECRRFGVGVSTRRRNPYAARLRDACQAKTEPERGVERLLIAALIEARSHERFLQLLPLLTDARLRRFYNELAEAEARHGPAYLELAKRRGGSELTARTLERLSDVESGALCLPCTGPIMVHSPNPPEKENEHKELR